jgi:type IV secretory pathway VirB6-like protein
MDSSPVWRRVTFAAIVCVLVALGAYLLGPLAHRQSQGNHQPLAASSPRASVPPVAASSPPATAGQPDIYQWLPFTSSGLAAAAAIATRFGTAYGTYSYTRSAADYAASLQPVTAPSLLGQIEAAYAAPGVAAARAGSKQVAVGVATIDAISAFGPTSLTFLVQIAQQITAATGTTDTSIRYSVTLTGNGSSWQVTGVELATVGNS